MTKRPLILTTASLVLALGLSAGAASLPRLGDLPLPKNPEIDSSLSDAFDSGDLVGMDGEASFGLDRGDLEDPALLYRAQSKKQLEEHSRKRVQIVVRKSMKERGYQFLTVHVDGSLQFEAPVSTAWERIAPGKTGAYRASTPPGLFFPDGMQPRRYSNRWQVWLQHVIRFNSGIWIHATTPDHFMELGAPASGGCVRMYPSDAKQVYEIVEKYGMNETAITVLQNESEEKQLPWKLQSLKAPEPLTAWRLQNKIR